MECARTASREDPDEKTKSGARGINDVPAQYSHSNRGAWECWEGSHGRGKEVEWVGWCIIRNCNMASVNLPSSPEEFDCMSD